MAGDRISRDLSSEQFARFRDWIHAHSGIFLEENKSDSLRISLVTRAARWELASFDDYYRMLETDEAEFKELMNLVTINETSFFRFPAQFDALRDRVIPEILENKPSISKSFRVWSAGCSTGEEPYTVGMSLLDAQLAERGFRPEVLGTDVSTAALDRAREGVYQARSIENLSIEHRRRYFEQLGRSIRVAEPVRDLVEFSYHNLIKEPYPLVLMGNWDVIFCRNVTIYFRLESTRRVVHNFFDSLNPGGYLFIGHSETLTSVSDRFEVVENDGVFLYRKPRPRRMFTFDDIVARREGRGAVRPTTMELSRSGGASADKTAAGEHTRKAGSRVKAGAAPAGADEAAGDTAPPAELVAAAYEHLRHGQPDEAIAVASRALARDERNVDACLVLAYAHADVGDFESAVAEAGRALGVDPLRAAAHYILGIIYQRTGRSEEALGAFRRTIYADSDFVLAHFSLANLLRTRGDYPEACRSYENTLRSLYASPEGSWTAFLGGFKPDLLAQTVERSLVECRKGFQDR